MNKNRCNTLTLNQSEILGKIKAHILPYFAKAEEEMIEIISREV